MNYFILPHNICNTKIYLNLTKEELRPCISHSLIYYLNNTYSQLSKIESINIPENYSINNNGDKIKNPFEFINKNMSETILSVSKVKPESNIFFELMEIFNLFNLTHEFSTRQTINICHLTHNHTSSNYLLKMLREQYNDNVYAYDFEYNNIYDIFIMNKFNTKLDLLICEFSPYDYKDIRHYIRNMLLVLLIISKYQTEIGTCIIKIDNIFYKAIIDIIFILSTLYGKTILIKPIISNTASSERYIICKSYNSYLFENSSLKTELVDTILTDIDYANKYVCSLLNDKVQYYFFSKLEESNIIIGQQQLETYNQIINVYVNKNCDEKIECLKKHNINKCIQWCEHNKLPHNKFIDKVNVFFTPKKNEVDFEAK